MNRAALLALNRLVTRLNQAIDRVVIFLVTWRI